MKQRKIAFVGLESHSRQACLSMLGIMAGMASVQWVEAEGTADADVLMATVECANQVPPGTPCILVYRSDDRRPSAPYTLSRPFRAMQLIGLLERIGQHHFDAADTSRSSEALEAAPLTSLHALADAMAAEPAPQGILPLQSTAGTFYLEPAQRRFFADEALLAPLVAGDIHFRKLLAPIVGPPQGQAPRPAFLLCWYLADADAELLPWLDPASSFRIRRWPHLGALPRSREHLALCALMSKAGFCRAQLAQFARCEEPVLDRFLNACALSGLLQVDRPDQAHVMAASGSGRFGGLIRGLRQRLGLAH